MNLKKMKALVEKYWVGDGYVPPEMTEHRVDLEWSEPIIYSMIRKYKPTPISKNDLLDLVESGVYSPSGSNTQCYRFIIINKKEDLDFLG